MKEQPSKTRSQEHEIEIDAPIDAVWKALTDAEQLTNWLSEEARVVPGEGGTVWVSWGEGQAGETRIEGWEPGRRLRLVQMPPENDPNQPSPFPVRSKLPSSRSTPWRVGVAAPCFASFIRAFRIQPSGMPSTMGPIEAGRCSFRGCATIS